MLDFRLPEVGENIQSGNVVKITVAVGELVKKDQPLLELETDKASLEVPSPCDGTIKEILIKEGQDVKIGQVIMRIDNGVVAAEPAKSATKKPELKEKAPVAPKKEELPVTPRVMVNAEPPPPLQAAPGKIDVPAAPSVRRFAREIGIEIAQVPGSGVAGRISIDDVKAYAKQLNLSRAASASGGGGIAVQPLPDFSKWGAIERQPMNNVRKKTAVHLSYCWSTIPHVTQFDKADITELEKLRKRYSTEKRKLTVTPFLMKVLASGLKTFPQFNASLDMATKEIIYKKYFHIGVAVDTDRGLLVPVIRDVDKKNIFELADELNETAQRARDRKTTLEELQGGNMSLTNLGGIGGTNFTPIVNWPEVAIVGVARGAWEPKFESNHFIPRFMLPLSLSYDHRLIDGADGARFLRWVCEALEQPFLMELEG